MNKEYILSHLNIKSFYHSIIPSLKVNGKSEAMGLCPFHDDHNPSLSLNLTSGLYRCFACDNKGDVFTFYQNLKNVDFKTTLKEIAEMQGISDTTVKQKTVARFEYKNTEGKILYIKERLEPARDGRNKEFIFKHLEGDKWITGRGCEPVPYNLPQVSKSKYAFITEGEAKADLLKSWKLAATCLDSGANSPFKDDYLKYFEGKEKVIILPDNDLAGKSYANKIASALYGKVERIKIVELPDLKNAEDVIDWVKIEDNDRARLLELVKASPEWQPLKEIEIEDEKEIEPDTPIIDLDYNSLPSFLKGLVDLISPTTLAPDEFIVTALLSAMSSVIGTRAYIQFGRRGFNASIWSMVIAPSSDSFKSTAIREARNFILKIDKEYEASYVEKFEDYKQELKKYELLSKENRLHTTEPIPPIRQEIDFSDDETLESFYQTLHDNTDGGLLAFDEIGGWIEGFDKYRKGSGEKRRWLTIFDNHPIKYKRKADKTHLNIDKPFVSIIGGITQNTFNKLFKGGVEDIENGFLPRFIFCKTPKLTKKDEGFLKPDIDHDKWEKAYLIFKKVMELKSGAIAPSQEGMEMLNDWYKQHQDQKKDPFYPEELSPFWRRLEGYLLKFALIFHQFKRATGEESGNLISVQTLTEAMSLTEYFKGQAWAVVRELCQGKEGRVFDDLLATIRKLGGKVTTRQIQHAKSYWRGRGDYLKEVLEKMEAEGIISLETIQGRGSQSLRIKLNA